MAGDTDMLAAIEAVHAAGLDAALWPDALKRVAETVGGIGASLEAVDRRTMRHGDFRAYGMPPAEELAYFSHYAALNPRWSLITRQKAGELGWDYRILEEAEMRRSPFYAEFLAKIDFPYFVYGMLVSTNDEFAGIAVHRSRKQGHVDRAGIDRLKRLVPHVRQAFDVTRRLRSAEEAHGALERALDWLADGIVLTRGDGTVVYANEAFQDMARRANDIGLTKGMLAFSSADARRRFEAALAAIQRLNGAGSPLLDLADFPVRRRSGAPSYLVSVRPILGPRRLASETDAVAIVFVHDPTSRHTAGLGILREVFGLTEAEASVARAIQLGQTLTDYARDRSVSVNTVYTHLRRIKEKTGCARMLELMRKLNDLQAAVRPE